MSGTLEVSVLALKNIRRLIVHGLRKPHEHNDVPQFLLNLLEDSKVVLAMSKLLFC